VCPPLARLPSGLPPQVVEGLRELREGPALTPLVALAALVERGLDHDLPPLDAHVESLALTTPLDPDAVGQGREVEGRGDVARRRARPRPSHSAE
jgi:hypothetical protein